MKLFAGNKHENLEHALKAAYRDRTFPELNLRWKQNTMRAIRAVSLRKTVFNPAMFAQCVVWRFVMVASVLTAMLLGYMWYYGLNPFYDLHEFFLEHPGQLTAMRQAYEEF